MDQESCANLTNRRSSSGVLLSPEVDLSATSSKSAPGLLGEANESDGFYLLKKDSQRRATLSKVLENDESKICIVWMEHMRSTQKELLITIAHLEVLIHGLRDYIMKQDKTIIEDAIETLRKSLDFDSTAIDHLHLALYSFQDAVITVLRSHSIKPHWMFALDNLVKSAVSAGIMILSPELGANITNINPEEEEDVPDELSTSGIETVNSAKMIKPNKSLKEYYRQQMSQIKSLNSRLMEDLLESQKSFQTILKNSLDNQQMNLSLLNTFFNKYERNLSQG